MAHAKQIDVASDDNITIGDDATKLSNIALGVGAVGLVGGVVLSGGLTTHFFASYLVAFMFVLAIGLGALWFVCIQHLTNAKWSVVVRRVGEIVAANMSVVGILSLVLIIPMAAGMVSGMYEWLDHAKVEESHLLHHKAGYLNLGFFLVRCGVYFGFWYALSRYYLRQSLAQDENGKPEISSALQKVSAPSMILFALTLTFCAIDFMMSIDAEFFSTIFGVYYFAGCVSSGYSFIVLSLIWLQGKGRLVNSVNREHYHDLGKMMFAFVVFWSYIAFSQFMLIWYADIPEETHWYKWRFNEDWRIVSGALLFCHFVIPFFGLLSRHVKRNRKTLAFWAIWLLVIEYVDLYWLIMPNLEEYRDHVPLSLADLLLWVGLMGIFIGMVARRAKGLNLVPTKDPRLADSLAFENV
jgi:hypothetical protein